MRDLSLFLSEAQRQQENSKQSLGGSELVVYLSNGDKLVMATKAEGGEAEPSASDSKATLLPTTLSIKSTKPSNVVRASSSTMSRKYIKFQIITETFHLGTCTEDRDGVPFSR